MEPPPRPSNQAAKAASTLPKLEVLDPARPHTFIQPCKEIHDGPDVPRFLTSKAYRDIGLFVMQLNHALCPRAPASGAATKGAFETFPLDAKLTHPPAVLKLQELLDKTSAIIGEAPPDPGPRRFGNISFRKWHSILEERADGLLKEFVPADVLGFGKMDEEESETTGAIAELKAYFLGGFGSAQRLDYGTGHELSFLAFLGCLWKLGAFKGGEDENTERSIVIGVVEPYLNVVRRLILTYTLEPAGSHGVWGLDDHSFIPYIFGSAQYNRPISAFEPTPLEGSLPGAPKPADVVKADRVAEYRTSNMYFSAIGFINDVKKGPFWEHSPILFDISGIKDGWGKINKGMIKMFNAEVLSKFPVVQHFPFGSLFSWEADPEAAKPIQTVHMANQPVAAAATAAATGNPPPTGFPGPGRVGGPGVEVGTAAPWAQTARSRIPPSGEGRPIASSSSARRALPPSQRPMPPGGKIPDTGPPPPTSFAKGTPGTASNQFAVTKAPWSKD
ncbi:PTPA-domain-containing protein [Thozetella sp. PMI_491]|nr:PTPA-domain-containing protein [Thozetella sp. PMI_491]